MFHRIDTGNLQYFENIKTFRNCSLAVLNTGNDTDDGKELLERYKDFDIKALDHEFFEACDKYGLLVFQDFWMSGDCNGRWIDPMKKEDQWTRRKYPDNHPLFLESAADMIKIAMINIHKDIKEQKLQSKMTMQVHDELVFDVIKTEKDQMKAIILNRMQTAIKTIVPIVVEIGEGYNWLEAH